MYKKVIEKMKEKGISKMQCAIQMGISPSDLYNALNGVKPLYPKYRKKLSEVLNTPESELFNEEGDDSE